jgi:predicted RNA-binding Zn-ribbon protein involved in translation (DUF1610 family)
MDDLEESTTVDSISTDLDSKLFEFFGTAKDVVARYTHCTNCGANLHFTHQTDFGKNLTFESAKCPECGHQAHRTHHKLQ